LQPFISEPILFFQSLGGISFNYFYKGDSRKTLEIGQTLLKHGERTESSRSLVVGHISIGHSHFVAGDIEAAISSYRQATEVARDPFYIQWPRLFVAMCLAQTAQALESEAALREVVQYGKTWGCESMSSPAYLFLGVLMIRRGHMSHGLRMIRQKLQDCRANERIFGIVWIEYLLGKIFLQLAERREKLPLMTAIRNMGFLVRYLPTAARRASQHFQNAIAAAQSIGARGILGQAYLDLGHLHRLVGRKEAARHCLIQAADQFEGCGAASYLEQARTTLNTVVSDTHRDRLPIRQQPP
jgi:tetratricopeptide (TPR) repeat protein